MYRDTEESKVHHAERIHIVINKYSLVVVVAFCCGSLNSIVEALCPINCPITVVVITSGGHRTKSF
jgi:hypothetical protein